MKTIETTANVGRNRKVQLQLPRGIAPGLHRFVVVVDDDPADTTPRRNFSSKEIRDFMEADKLPAALARKVQRILDK